MLTVFELTNPLTPAINLDAPIERAVFLFEKSNLSMLPVVDKGVFCGVLERIEVEKLPGFSGARASDLLSREMPCLSSSDAANIAVELLSTGIIDLVPVTTDDGIFMGIVSAEDVPPSLWKFTTQEVEGY
ncbi:MAG: HPP family protein [Saprospiraceae bacterium]